MGWDAHSSVKMQDDPKKPFRIKDKKLRKEFQQAVHNVLKHVEYADGYLHIGSLDISWAGKYLEKATGHSVYNPNGWGPEVVKFLHETADWDFRPHHLHASSYWSAREFLRVCAENDLSISFSW